MLEVISHTSCGQAALSYAEFGWRVLPVDGKRPLLMDWPNEATTDPLTVGGWWAKWPEAAVGIATGEGSGLVVIDVDSPKGGDDALDALEDCLGRLPSTVEVMTGGGGRHLYFQHPGSRVPNRQNFSIETTAGAVGVDVRGDGGLVVAPPSRHPSGALYEWEASSDPSQVGLAKLPQEWLLALTVSRAPDVPSETCSRTVLPLSKAADVLLRLGASDDKASSTLLRIANSAVVQGWSDAQLFWALMDPTNGGGAALRDRAEARGQQEAWRWFSGVWAKAWSGLQESPVAGELRAIQAAIEQVAWRGQSGSTDRAVLEALCRMCMSARRQPFAASVRDVAHGANISAATAQKALARLQGSWIKVETQGRHGRAQELRLTVPSTLELTTLSKSGVENVPTSSDGRSDDESRRVAPPAPQHDAWSYGGLNKSGHRIWKALEDAGPSSAKQLSLLLPMAYSTVSRTLRKLEAAGLVRRDQRLWWHVNRDLDEVATELGVDGRREHRVRRIAVERMVYGAFREGERVIVRDGRLINVLTGETVEQHETAARWYVDPA